MRQNEASEIIALQVFVALCNHEEELGYFLNEVGTDLGTLKSSIQQPETLAAVLDFTLNNENLLLEICQEINLKPNAIWRARLDLPGSPEQNYSSI